MRFESLQKVAVALGQERSLAILLKRIVDELARRRGVALARVWMAGPAEQCEVCRAKPHAPNAASTLHLAASTGHPLQGGEDWSRLNGDFHRGGAKIRQIRDTGKPLLIDEVGEEKPALRDWVRREKIRSFAGYPLVFGGEQVGVVAVLARVRLTESDFEWLRIFAVAMAGTIINARAFDEFERLRDRLESENAYLRAEVSEVVGSSRILGSSAGIRRVLEEIAMVAPTDATVLVLGETGVGKELVARAIHERSARHDHQLVKVNCTAIPRELFESEFFGHVKGAFSSASSDRMGRFQIADRGSLFLDEVGDLPPEMQPKLLRVLQDGEFQAVGEDRPRHADIRIIAASNHDLEKDVPEGKFREDLFYRLSVFPIKVPPLRERKQDIPILAQHFLEAACRRFNRSPLQLSANQIGQLQNYGWPGNVRELQNVIERAVITARLGSLHLDVGDRLMPRPMAQPAYAEGAATEIPEVFTEEEMKRRDRENIIATLAQSGGRIYGPGGAAELLGMKPTTLTARIKKLGLRKLP